MSELTPASIDGLLKTKRLGRPCIVLEACGSTNDEAAIRGRQGHPEGTLVVSEEQTAGRGRRGRVWHSPRGENLYLSLLLRPPIAPEQATPLTLLAGLALATALQDLSFSPRLKWPNDVLLELAAKPRKVAGILMELACQGGSIKHLVLGVGINVGSRSFPPDLEDRATSLDLSGSRPTSRPGVLAQFLNRFEFVYDHFLVNGPREGLEEYRRFAILGQPCFVERDGQHVEGIAKEIDETGALVMQRLDGSCVPIHAGEVNWLRTM